MSGCIQLSQELPITEHFCTAICVRLIHHVKSWSACLHCFYTSRYGDNNALSDRISHTCTHASCLHGNDTKYQGNTCSFNSNTTKISWLPMTSAWPWSCWGTSPDLPHVTGLFSTSVVTESCKGMMIVQDSPTSMSNMIQALLALVWIIQFLVLNSHKRRYKLFFIFSIDTLVTELYLVYMQPKKCP